jgi:hypothetical protein
MKSVNFPITLLVGACSVLLSSAPITRAVDPPQADQAGSAQPSGTASVAAAPSRLPYGVEDIVKLSHAQISEDVILNYVRNSGTIYNLAPADIVVLRNEGVSDHVINAMLDQRKNVTEAAAQAQPAQAATAPTTVAPAPAPQPDYQATQPAVYMESSAPSSVYVIPYPSATYAYYSSGYYPYYGGYYGYGRYGYCGPYYRPYCGPRVVVGYGYGGGHGHHHGHW